MSIVHYISTNTIQLAKNKHTKIELTPWDLQFLHTPPIQLGLFYPKPKSSHPMIVDHLKASLSRTLELYYPLAGRLGLTDSGDGKTSSFSIDCNNAGALFAHAVANVTIRDMLEPLYVPSILRSFFLLNGMHNHESISQPLLAVQVTELVDGFFIGCTMNHAICDGTAFWQFLESWSEISRGSTTGNIPVLKRWFPSNVNFPIRLPITSTKLEDKFVYLPLEERVFHFPKEKIAALKVKANAEMGTNNISSLQALLAHIWQGIVQCRGTAVDQEVKCIFAIDTRQRLQPALPKTYFGSAINGGIINITAGKLLNHSLGWAALEMNKVVAQQTDSGVRSFLNGWLENPKFFSSQAYDLIIYNSPRFDFFKIDFGWGKPVMMRSGSAHKTDGSIILHRGLEEGSIDITICLLPENLNALGKDEDFMKAVGP